jgi:hypothetical protein
MTAPLLTPPITQPTARLTELTIIIYEEQSTVGNGYDDSAPLSERGIDAKITQAIYTSEVMEFKNLCAE